MIVGSRQEGGDEIELELLLEPELLLLSELLLSELLRRQLPQLLLHRNFRLR